MNMIDKYYIGWLRDGKGRIKYRPRKHIANALTSKVWHGITDPRDGLGKPRRMWCMSLNRNKIFQFTEQL